MVAGLNTVFKVVLVSMWIMQTSGYGAAASPPSSGGSVPTGGASVPGHGENDKASVAHAAEESTDDGKEVEKTGSYGTEHGGHDHPGEYSPWKSEAFVTMVICIAVFNLACGGALSICVYRYRNYDSDKAAKTKDLEGAVPDASTIGKSDKYQVDKPDAEAVGS